MQDPVDRPPPGAKFVCNRLDVLRDGHVELEHVGRRREVAGHPTGQRQAAPGSRQHHVGVLVLGQAGHGVRQGVVGQHPGDHDPLSSQKSGHAPSP